LPVIFAYFLFVDSSFRDEIFLDDGLGYYILVVWGLIMSFYLLCIVIYSLMVAYTPFRNKYLDVYCNTSWETTCIFIIVFILWLFYGLVFTIVSVLNLNLIWLCDTLLLKNGVFTFIVFIGCVVGIIYVVGVVLYNIYCKKDIGEEA